MNDLRVALRQLRKSPGFTIVAVLTLALGIGLNTSLFSVVNRVLLSPLPFKDPSRLVILNSVDLESSAVMGTTLGPVSGPDFLDWREQSQSFENMAVSEFGVRLNLSGVSQPVALSGARVTSGFFETFGIPLHRGRAFREAELEAGDTRQLVLSHGLWQRQFGSDPDVVGQKLTVDGESFIVVGILSPTLGFLDELAEAYLPITSEQLRGDRMSRYLIAFGRLKSTVLMEQANAEMNTIAAALGEEYPAQRNLRVRLESLHDQLVKVARPAFWVLHGAVGLLLLIACVNVATLLLARTQSRQRELAIRAALGAGRFRAVRQMLTEGVLLGLVGGAAGLVVAFVGVDLLVAMSPKLGGRSIPFFAEIGVDGRVLGYNLFIALLAGVAMALAPACQAAKPDLALTLNETGRGGTSGVRRHRLLNSFVVAQVALSMVLLLGAGVLIGNLRHLSKVDPGFDPANLLTLGVELPEKTYSSQEDRVGFYSELIRRTEALPGVESVGLVNHLPMAQRQNNIAFVIEGVPPLPEGKYSVAEYRLVNHFYFPTLKIPLQAGRWFTSQDRGEGSRVAVINANMARTFFPEGDVLGRRIKVLGGTNVYDIVGIVGNEKFFGLATEDPPMMYQPFLQDCWGEMSLAIRTKSEPLNLAGAVRQQIRELDPDLPVTDVRSMGTLVKESISVQRFTTTLLGGFSLVGMLLAAIGLYGVLAYVVSQRSREIGVRMALGASVRQVVLMIITQGMKLLGIGVIIGLMLAFGLGRLLSGFLRELNVIAPLTCGGVILLLAGVALLACFVPARRAARIDPLDALRME